MSPDRKLSYGSSLIKFYIDIKSIQELAKDILFLQMQYQTKCDSDFDESWMKFVKKRIKFQGLYEKLKPAGALKNSISELLETGKLPDFFMKVAKMT